jgi:type 1 glutamine amidotransferase
LLYYRKRESKTPRYRRQLLGRAAAGALAAAALPGRGWAMGKERRLLCFTKSSGFEHSVVKRGADGSPSLVERVLTEQGKRHGFTVECTKDGSVFTPEGLRDFDAFFFYTSGMLDEAGTDGNPPMPPGGKQALIDAVRSGKGFVATHASSDSFHTKPDPKDRSNRYVAHGAATDPYLRMLGGEFISHGKQQDATMRIVDAAFPGMDAFGAAEVRRWGEWYSLKDFMPDLHVLAVLDTQGMPDTFYQRGPYPVTWARREGRGRVFYSALGHLEREWAEPAFLGMVTGALRWAFGDVEASTPPNLARVAPRYADIPPFPSPSTR